MRDLLFGALSGDMAALTGVFIVFGWPIMAVIGIFSWLSSKVKK